MTKKRIAILADALDLQYAGVHVYLRGLLSALLRLDSGHEYLLVRPRPGGEFQKAKEIVVPIIKSIPGHQYWRALTAIPRRLASERVDVVVEPAHFGPFNLPKGVKRLTVIHDLTPVLFPGYHSLASSLVHKLTLPGIFKRADAIIANSNYTKGDIEKNYPAASGKIGVVRPGLETIFRPTSDGSVLQKYGLRQPYLLFVGTLEPRKNLLSLLRAYENFRRSGPAMQLVLVGREGWKNKDFFTALEASPYRADIVLTGYTERAELPVLYSMAHLFVYPSRYEGFGLPALEAMACGAPVLLSRSSSLPEVGGTAAAYFDPSDLEDFSKKLLQTATGEQNLHQMAKASLQQAALFDWEESARAFLSFL
jgi:glycosyltransferase involved in cell wall biosynthesis